jgi:hypothetical protein
LGLAGSVSFISGKPAARTSTVRNINMIPGLSTAIVGRGLPQLPESDVEIRNFSGQDGSFWLSALITYQQQAA